MKNYYNSLRTRIFLNCEKMYLTIFILFATIFAQGQTTLISPTGDGGFQNGSTFSSNGWTVSNSANNPWLVGTLGAGTPMAGNKAFISNDAGVTNAYTPANNALNYFYRDVTVPVGESKIALTFNWAQQGETSFDIWQVYTCPTSTVPTGAAAHPGSGQLLVPAALIGATCYAGGVPATGVQTTNLFLPSTLAGTTFRIVFSWKNETGGTQPPASIDNISLVSSLPSTFTAAANGGLWSSPATWVGGVVPTAADSAIIPNGTSVTIDSVTSVNNVTIAGQLNQIATLNVIGNLTIGATGKYYPHTATTGQTINVGGDFINNGYANLAMPSSTLIFNGSQVGGSTAQTFGGTGSFLGNASGGLIRALSFQTTGTSTINTTQNLIVTAGYSITAGSVNTNAKLTIDNTAQVFGQALNTQVNNAYISNMGAGYVNAPIVFGRAANLWVPSATATINTYTFSGNNVYLVTAAGAYDAAVAPTHTAGNIANGTATLLWVGNTGNLGNPMQTTATTLGTQYFYGDNLYVCTVAGVFSATAPPVHLSGTAVSGAATFLYVGSAAKASLNHDATTQTVRSINIINSGAGYSAFPSAAISPNGGVAPTTVSVAFVVLIQSIQGGAIVTTAKSGVATISGGLTINSNQGASAFSGVGNVVATNGGVNYTTLPTVGFSGPTAVNLVTNGGTAYTTAPTITVSGGTLVSATPLTTASFSIIVAQGQVVSVYLTGAATYSVPPTLTITGGGGSGATLEFPANCWPAATAVLGSNGQITNFTMTNAGFGYSAAPTVGVGIVTATSTGGTFTTVASGISARIALYNLSYGWFLPAVASVVNNEGAEVPSNRKINNYTINNATGANFTGNLLLFSATPLTLTAGVSNFGASNVTFANPNYAGLTGSTTTNINANAIVLNTPGGSLTRTFPFDASLVAVLGTGSLNTGSTVTTLTATRTAPATGTVTGGGSTTGTRAYRLQTNAGAVYGTLPTVTLNYNGNDGLASDNASLFIAQAAALSGVWTVRTVAAAAGALPATGNRVTATTAPGPIVPTTDDYYAWTSTLVTYQSTTSGNWNNGSTWLGGVVPPTGACEQVFIMNGHNVTVNSAGNAAKSLTINTGGTLTVASGDLTVGCVDKNNLLINNGTLTVSGGILNVNGSVLNSNGSTFNQSAGDIIVDGNSGSAATSLPITVDMFSFGTSVTNYASGNVNVSGGNLKIVNPHFVGTANSSGGAAFSFRAATTGRIFGVAHNTTFGPATQASTATFGYFVDCYVNSALFMFGTVNVNGGTGSLAVQTNAVSGGGGLNCGGDLNISTGSELLDLNSAGGGVSVGGNVTNNGTFTQTNTTGLRLGLMTGTNGTTFGVTTVAQTIGGSGVFRNLASADTAKLTSLNVNNSNAIGVTLNTPLSVSGTTTLTLGKVNTTNTNLLTLGTATTAGTLVGGSATAYVVGPLSRRFAVRASSGTYDQTTLYPVGKSSAYLPVHLAPTTTVAGLNLRAESFTTNAGTFVNPIIALGSNRWEVSAIAGTFTDIFIRENDAAVVATDEILQSPTAGGIYSRILPVVTTTVAGATLTTATAMVVADFTGFLSYGKPCTTPPAPTGAATQSFCGTGKTIADLVVTPLTGHTIKWYDLATAGTQLPTSTVLVTGTNYYASQISTAGGCESITRLNVGVTVTNVNNGVTLALDTFTASQSGASYQWFTCPGNVVIPGATNQTFTATSSGDYGVTVTLAGCSVDSSCVTYTTLGLENNIMNTFNIYPNPISDILNIQHYSDINKITIYNMLGQQVLTKNVSATSTQIDMSALTNGTYLVKVEAGSVSKTIKVFKK